MNITKRFLSVTAMAFCAMAMTVSAQDDYTSLITNPSFESKSLDGWTSSNFTLTNNKNFTKVDGDWCVEKWVSSGNNVGSASISQTVHSLPTGRYMLTVAAQNYNQASTATNCTGAYIYAIKQTNKTTVCQPNDYTVNFTTTNGKALIGFSAVSATGNWLCVDNFRLKRVGDADPAQCRTSLDSLVTVADALLTSTMTSEYYVSLNSAIDNGKAITDASAAEELSNAIVSLDSSIEEARVSIAACKAFATKLKTATTYQGKYMQQSISDKLDSIVTMGEKVGSTMSEADFQALNTSIDAVTESAKTSSASYTTLSSALTSAGNVYDETKNEAAALKAAIDEAQAMYDGKATAADGVDSETEVLKKATLAFNIANATPGSGAAPTITYTNPYVPTGATQALMRFTYTGSFIKEKGVCWSTEHNPTVLDERSTDILANLNGNIYRVKGLSNATVYYLRPYVMNNTYTVVYGDEVKIVTHPRGTCSWTWDEAGPDDATNDRCRTALKETIDYFNEWTGISGFTLSGHYVPGAGSGTGTADCSYGGYMRISQNTANQAIGTVLHETGHGVGVGTQTRYWDSNVHSWKWYGSETNKIYSFLENKEADPYTSDFCWVGDNTHAWGASATYDWCINGSDKDKHVEIQYAGGCILLYGMFIDGLCPTTSYTNGLAGYTYNFDDAKKYYLMCKDADYGLNSGLITATNAYAVRWVDRLSGGEVTDADAWYMSYDPRTGLYSFKNAAHGKYLKHPTTSNAILGFATSTVKTPTSTEMFQLMPARTDVTVKAPLGTFTTKGYWLTTSDLKGMQAQALSNGTGKINVTSFDYADTATREQWIILSEDDMKKYYGIGGYKKGDVNHDGNVDQKDIEAIIDVICGDKTYKDNADVTGSGSVDVTDVNTVISLIYGN